MATHKEPQPGSRSETASKLRDTIGGLAAKAAAGMSITVDSFMDHAMSATLYELEAAHVALQRSRREDVRAFAQRMVDDHTKIKSELGSFLGETESPTRPAEKMMKLHQVLIDDLHGAKDEDFDQRYISQQQAAHSEAITLFKTYRDHGSLPGLQNLCRLGLPVLEEHARMADQLARAH